MVELVAEKADKLVEVQAHAEATHKTSPYLRERDKMRLFKRPPTLHVRPVQLRSPVQGGLM